jgi:hypothetical protein
MSTTLAAPGNQHVNPTVTPSQRTRSSGYFDSGCSHSADLCFAEIKHGGGNVCTHHLSYRNNGRGYLSVRPGHESILFGYNLGPTRDGGVEPTLRGRMDSYGLRRGGLMVP